MVMPVKHKGIVIIIFAIHTRCQQLKVMVMFKQCNLFATGPGLGLIMYILTTLEFPKHNHDFQL